jgi:hypothetical protein
MNRIYRIGKPMHFGSVSLVNSVYPVIFFPCVSAVQLKETE